MHSAAARTRLKKMKAEAAAKAGAVDAKTPVERSPHAKEVRRRAASGSVTVKYQVQQQGSARCCVMAVHFTTARAAAPGLHCRATTPPSLTPWCPSMRS